MCAMEAGMCSDEPNQPRLPPETSTVVTWTDGLLVCSPSFSDFEAVVTSLPLTGLRHPTCDLNVFMKKTCGGSVN